MKNRSINFFLLKQKKIFDVQANSYSTEFCSLFYTKYFVNQTKLQEPGHERCDKECIAFILLQILYPIFIHPFCSLVNNALNDFFVLPGIEHNITITIFLFYFNINQVLNCHCLKLTTSLIFFALYFLMLCKM